MSETQCDNKTYGNRQRSHSLHDRDRINKMCIRDRDLTAGNLDSFEGKNIGVFKDNITEDVLNEWELKYGLHMPVSYTHLKYHNRNFYADSTFSTYKDHLILAADGSDINIPTKIGRAHV